MMRKVLAVVGGFVAGSIVMTLIEMVGQRLYLLPLGIDPNDPKSLAANADRIPVGAMAMVVLAWFVGCAVGVATAALVAPGSRDRVGLVVAVLFFLAGVANLVMIPSPAWMWVAGLASFPLGALVARAGLARFSPPGPQPS